MHRFTADKLRQLLESWTQPAGYWIAFSGGADSTALLHAMAQIRSELGVEIRAIHINHGLHPEARNWQTHCEQQCHELGITLLQKTVRVEPAARKSPEAQARAARYTAMLAEIEDGDMLLTGHHADDQAETLILNLMRGAGVAGLAAMHPLRKAGSAWLGRPLLNWNRRQLRQYLADENIPFIDDPSNEDRSIRRNFIRHEILPRLAKVWPAATEQVNKSAVHARTASAILKSVARADLAICLGAYRYEVNLERMCLFDNNRQALIIRQWARENALSTPDQRQLNELLQQLQQAREGSALCMKWPGVEVHRYRSKLFIMAALPDSSQDWRLDWDGRNPISLPYGTGELHLKGVNGTTFDDRPLEVHARGGSERLQPVGQTHHKSLKQLFQSAGVPPWLRSRIPLLSRGGQCLAVGDVWLDQAFADMLTKSGLSVHWQPGLQQWRDTREHILANQ